MFKNYNHLGFSNPYFYLNKNMEFELESTFSEICNSYTLEKEIDLVSIIEILNKGYILGDRTLIKGINRSPWMSKPTLDLKNWQVYNVKDHDEKVINEIDIAKSLFRRICDEILDYIKESNNIGILLSGGMDSRIVAGTLDYLIKTGEAKNIQVVGLTWGDINSRDVQYAKEIAHRLKWEWKHYIVTPDDLLQNINETAINGCEYSPIHLHALPQIRDDNNLDVVLAGSFGDSIGRAEYSSVKVENLKPINRNFRNPSSIINNKVFSKYFNSWNIDVENYHNKFPQNKAYKQYEQDYQLHYMRRMLNPCMEIIGNKMKFRQVFTSPEVFEYMWQIDPSCRNNNVYKYILGFFTTSLEDIPWARTGLPYGSNYGKRDSFSSTHHSYKNYICKDIHSQIESLVMSNEIENLNIFNMSALKKILSLVKNVPHESNAYIEILSWIASLSKAISFYNLKVEKIDTNTINNNILANIQTPIEFYLRKSFSDIKKRVK